MARGRRLTKINQETDQPTKFVLGKRAQRTLEGMETQEIKHATEHVDPDMVNEQGGGDDSISQDSNRHKSEDFKTMELAISAGSLEEYRRA